MARKGSLSEKTSRRYFVGDRTIALTQRTFDQLTAELRPEQLETILELSRNRVGRSNQRTA